MRLNSRQRNVIILRVFRTTQQNITGGPLITTLSSKLNEDDSILFLEKYSGVKGNSTKPLFTQTEIEQGLEVVDFPLKLKDDITSSRLNNYVSAFMDDMPDSMRIFCGFVAFASYYADRALNQNQYEFKVYIEFAEKYQYTIYEWVGGKKQEKIKTVNKNQTLEFANTEEGQILFSSIINGKEDETISDLKGRYFKCTKAEYDNNTGRIKAIRFVEQVRGTVVN